MVNQAGDQEEMFSTINRNSIHGLLMKGKIVVGIDYLQLITREIMFVPMK